MVITGGVISGIGKGVTASSLGLLLKMMGLRPTAIKVSGGEDRAPLIISFTPTPHNHSQEEEKRPQIDPYHPPTTIQFNSTQSYLI